MDFTVDRFSDAVAGWFSSEFEDGATPIQLRSWERIAAGENVLVSAPTGSGKTLAAFLYAIDETMSEKARERESGKKPEKGVRILYISPMKALGADVERNLARPLQGIERQSDIPITVGMRTGDTPPDERRRLIGKPPDILITTPESLYLMLTSQAAKTLRTVTTIIVDEIHSLAGTKRGAHLALSLERLGLLQERPAQRIGLSATVRPLEEVARFLGGSESVEVVADDAPPKLDIEVRVPVPDMTQLGRTEAGTASIWPYLESTILDEVMSHTSTIVFVNSRGLCERLTSRLNELHAKRRITAEGHRAAKATESESAIALDASSPDSTGTAYRASLGSITEMARPVPVGGNGTIDLIAKSHHGSVSKERRHAIESELKRGHLRCVVATTSLELGIDMGDVDLVIQVAPPPSVASGLQRVGRAGHQVGGRSHGLILPRMRHEIVDAAVTSESMMLGAIERTTLVLNPLDVLSQQTVAHVAMHPDGANPDEWYECVRRSANFATLTREGFDSIVAMLAGAYASADMAEISPRIVYDGERDLMLPRPNSQRIAVTGAGTIPDKGLFPVMLPQADGNGGRRRVGELDEEMVMESRVGDIITLGTSTWKITEIARDRVIVEPAKGRMSRLPFWHGDAAGRPYDAGLAKGAFLRSAEAALEGGAQWPEDFEERLTRDGLDENARHNLSELLAAQRASTERIPTDQTLIAEKCADELGQWQLVLHSPFGRAVNAPWALAISARIRETLGFDPKAMAADDGIILKVPIEEESFPSTDILKIAPDELERLVLANIESTALFTSRFRECAARALTMTPTAPGKRMPLWQQRIRGGQLLEAARTIPGFPLLAEAARECLTEAYDLPALKDVLTRIARGDIRMLDVETLAPSPFCAPLLFGYTIEHLYDGDLPHAENRSALLTVDPALLGELMGNTDQSALIDPQALMDVEAVLQRTVAYRRVRGIEGVADLLRELGPLTTEEVAERTVDPGASDETRGGEAESPEPSHATAAGVATMLQTLADSKRIFAYEQDGTTLWAAAADGPALHSYSAIAVPQWAQSAPLRSSAPEGIRAEGGMSARHLLDQMCLRFANTHAPFDADEAARRTACGVGAAEESLGRLAEHGRVQPYGKGSWVTPAVLRRLRARSAALAEEAAEPVGSDAYVDFILERQGVRAAMTAEDATPPEASDTDTMVSADDAIEGIDALIASIEQLEGIPLPARSWEDHVFPSRVRGYRPSMLDELLRSGEVIWRGFDIKGKAHVAFYPTDSPVAPRVLDGLREDAEEMDITAGPDPEDEADSDASTPKGDRAIDRALGHALASEGPSRASSLPHACAQELDERPSIEAICASLRRLALNGTVTCGTFAFVRGGLLDAAPEQRHSGCNDRVAAVRPNGSNSPLPNGSMRRAHSRRTRLSSTYLTATKQAKRDFKRNDAALKRLDAALAGTWCAIGDQTTSSTELALSIVDGLLDCYGVITRETALKANVPGGFSALYPVLRALEDSGELIRGRFVTDAGPAQFCTREDLEAMRAHAHERADDRMRVMAYGDPAWLFGEGIPWPPIAFDIAGDSPALDIARLSTAPKKQAGALLVLRGGRPLLHASPKLKNLISFTDSAEEFEFAVDALVSSLQQQAKAQRDLAKEKLLIETLNGVPIDDTPLLEALKDAGFVWTPIGLRLYLNPF